MNNQHCLQSPSEKQHPMSSKTVKCIASLPGLQLGSRLLASELFQRCYTFHSCTWNFIHMNYLKNLFGDIFLLYHRQKNLNYVGLKWMQLIYISKLGLVSKWDYILCSHVKVLLDILWIFQTLVVIVFKGLVFFLNKEYFWRLLLAFVLTRQCLNYN